LVYIFDHFKHILTTMVYSLHQMPEDGSHLKELRQRADIGLREAARQLKVTHTKLVHWEKTGKIPDPDFIMRLAELYSVSVEEVLGHPKSKALISPNSKMAKLFAEAASLPRQQQRRVAEFLEDMLTAQKAKAS
jgi:transcriptional regulator with XRE-family HTH domain